MKPDLTDAQVREILGLRGALPAREVGQIYSRATETIRRIWRGDVYQHVTLEKTPATPLTDLPGEEDAAADALLKSLTNKDTPA